MAVRNWFISGEREGPRKPAQGRRPGARPFPRIVGLMGDFQNRGSGIVGSVLHRAITCRAAMLRWQLLVDASREA